MNKSNSLYIKKQVYNTCLYESFFKTFWTQIRLIMSRIYSFFQQKLYKNITHAQEKMLTLQKLVLISKEIKKLVPDKFEEMSQYFMNFG